MQSIKNIKCSVKIGGIIVDGVNIAPTTDTVVNNTSTAVFQTKVCSIPV